MGSSPGLHLEMQSDQPGSEVLIMRKMMFLLVMLVMLVMVKVMIWAMKGMMMKMVVPLGI